MVLVDVIVIVPTIYQIRVISGVVAGSSLTIYMKMFMISQGRLHVGLVVYLSLWPRAG